MINDESEVNEMCCFVFDEKALTAAAATEASPICQWCVPVCVCARECVCLQIFVCGSTKTSLSYNYVCIRGSTTGRPSSKDIIH